MSHSKFSVKYCVLLPIVLIVTIFLWAAPLSFFGIDALTVVQQRMIAIFVFAALMWMFEIIPNWTTSLIVIVVMLLTVSDKGIRAFCDPQYGTLIDYKSIMASFADPVVMLFLGGFVLAIVASKYGMDAKLAKVLLGLFGKNPKFVLLGFLLVISLFSMFMSNTATAAMMLAFLAPVLKALPDNETGRVSKIFAMALKARALLYAASPLNNPAASTDPQKWIEAAKAAKAIIDSAPSWNLSLVSFDKLLGAENYKEAEMILVRRLGDTNELERLNFPIGLEGGNGGNCPTQNLVDAYDMKAGCTFDPANPYANRDPRLAYTVLCHGGNTAYGKTVDVSYNGLNGLPKEGATRTGYYLSKFVNTSISLTANSTTSARHSIPLFRYAEILLIYAEAMNEAYGPNATQGDLNLSALEAINMVRGRAGLDIAPLTLDKVATKDAFRMALRKERMAELAFEDHRFWDIRRWKIGPETVQIKRVAVTKEGEGYSYEYTTTSDRIWNDKMYFYPIPQGELYKNAKLKQNPGWEI